MHASFDRPSTIITKTILSIYLSSHFIYRDSFHKKFVVGKTKQMLSNDWEDQFYGNAWFEMEVNFEERVGHFTDCSHEFFPKWAFVLTGTGDFQDPGPQHVSYELSSLHWIGFAGWSADASCNATCAAASQLLWLVLGGRAPGLLGSAQDYASALGKSRILAPP